MQAIRIEDPADPRIAGYVDIRERDLARRDGLFVAEGRVVLNVLFTAGRFAPHSVLMLENRLEGMRAPLTSAPPELPIFVAGQDVLDRIAGFHLHRGILALVRRGDPQPAAAMLDALPADAVVVVLVGLSNHDNVGSVFRNAAAFGADAVLLDPACCDPLYRKSIRVSVGAALKVPFATAAAADMPVLLGERGFDQYALSPAGRIEIGGIRHRGRTAIYLGTEGDGLPPALMQRIETCRIAIAEGFDSLNVAAASAVALHRLFRRG